MNLQKIALLTGLTVASVLGSGALSPAHAIVTTYVISNGSLSDGGTLSGSFNYDPVTSIYDAFNLLVSASTQNSQQSAITYTMSNSMVITPYSYRTDINSVPVIVGPATGFQLSLKRRVATVVL